MRILPTRLSTGPVLVSTRRMRIATHSPPALTTLERVLQPLPATQSTTLNSLASYGMERGDFSTTMQQLVWMRMEISMRMESLRPVEDILRYIHDQSIKLLSFHIISCLTIFIVDGVGQDVCYGLWSFQMC